MFCFFESHLQFQDVYSFFVSVGFCSETKQSEHQIHDQIELEKHWMNPNEFGLLGFDVLCSYMHTESL